jgi:hypothetical protein
MVAADGNLHTFLTRLAKWVQIPGEVENICLSIHLKNGKIILNTNEPPQWGIICDGLVEGIISWSQDGCILAVTTNTFLTLYILIGHK